MVKGICFYYRIKFLIRFSFYIKATFTISQLNCCLRNKIIRNSQIFPYLFIRTTEHLITAFLWTGTQPVVLISNNILDQQVGPYLKYESQRP